MQTFLISKKGILIGLNNIGDDKYNVRSDNLLGKTYHITPCQLYTIFKKQTWLEKQGKLSEEIEYNPFDDFRNSDVEVDSNEDGLIAETIRYKKETQGEQKTANVKPKFKVGDYVVGKYISGYISEVRDGCYLLGYQGFTIDKQDNYHLWTIQDAKDGDVLAYENDIVIFKENNYNPKDESGCMFVYCSCNNFYEIGGINPTDYKPATKEQRDTLLKAMTDAGYTFDFEKKELKKIENKNPMLSNFFKAVYEREKADAQNPPKWSEEDESRMDNYF